MIDRIKEDLSKEEQPEWVKDLHKHCLTLVDRSRGDMQKHYDNWDKQQEVYEGLRHPDVKDKNAQDHEEPVKMNVQLTRSQVDTFVSFLFTLYFQRPKFFEFNGLGPEDDEIRMLVEQAVDIDMKTSKFPLCLNQFLLNIAKFNIGILKNGWMKTTKTLFVEQTVNEAGVEITLPDRIPQAVTTFEGNKIISVDPYRFFPDTRLPMSRWNEGEFCAHEDEYNKIELKDMESQGHVAGLEFVSEFDSTRYESRKNTRFSSIRLDDRKTQDNTIWITEVEIKLIPSKYKLSDGKPLLETDTPTLFLVWIANDGRIVKVEPESYAHCEFNYEVSQFDFDDQQELGSSLTDIIQQIQKTIDWLINSRVDAVNRTLDNQLVVDPQMVDMKTVQNRSRVILLNRAAPRSGISRAVAPLPVIDTTQNHMGDANQLHSLMQIVTGLGENMLGQYHSGRRSATEARSVTQGAAARAVRVAFLIYTSALEPLGRKLAISKRQFLSEEGFNAMVGENEQKRQLFPKFKSDLASLARNVDFMVFDATLPSEKAFVAQSLQELVISILSSPDLGMSLGLDVNKMIYEIYELRGINNLTRFQKSQEQMMRDMIQSLMLQTQQNGPPQPAPTAGPPVA